MDCTWADAITSCILKDAHTVTLLDMHTSNDLVPMRTRQRRKMTDIGVKVIEKKGNWHHIQVVRPEQRTVGHQAPQDLTELVTRQDNDNNKNIVQVKPPQKPPNTELSGPVRDKMIRDNHHAPDPLNDVHVVHQCGMREGRETNVIGYLYLGEKVHLMCWHWVWNTMEQQNSLVTKERNALNVLTSSSDPQDLSNNKVCCLQRKIVVQTNYAPHFQWLTSSKAPCNPSYSLQMAVPSTLLQSVEQPHSHQSKRLNPCQDTMGSWECLYANIWETDWHCSVNRIIRKQWAAPVALPTIPQVIDSPVSQHPMHSKMCYETPGSPQMAKSLLKWDIKTAPRRCSYLRTFECKHSSVEEQWVPVCNALGQELEWGRSPPEGTNIVGHLYTSHKVPSSQFIENEVFLSIWACGLSHPIYSCGVCRTGLFLFLPFSKMLSPWVARLGFLILMHGSVGGGHKYDQEGGLLLGLVISSHSFLPLAPTDLSPFSGIWRLEMLQEIYLRCSSLILLCR